MPEWQFPNALAVVVKEQAARRGQTADRVIPRGEDEEWPEPVKVKRWWKCPRAPLGCHHGDDFCVSCGSLIAD